MNLWILLPTAAGVIAGVISYLTKRAIDTVDQKIVATNKRINELSAKVDQSNAELRREFYEFKDKVVDEFVKKEDYILTSTDLNKKMDKIYDILLDLKGRIK
jgi:oligoendopeptidase F